MNKFLTLLVTLFRSGRVGPDTLRQLAVGLLKNPMIVSTVLGLMWGATGRSLWPPVQEFMVLLGAAATPCANADDGISTSSARKAAMAVAALARCIGAASKGSGSSISKPASRQRQCVSSTGSWKKSLPSRIALAPIA